METPYDVYQLIGAPNERQTRKHGFVLSHLNGTEIRQFDDSKRPLVEVQEAGDII